MGIFDLLSPILSLIDNLFFWVPEILRLTFWALVAAVITMKTYERFSNQSLIQSLKPEIKAAQIALAKYDGEFEGLWPLMAKSFILSGRHIGLTLKPALIASVPVLFILVWVSNSFSTFLPESGEKIVIKPKSSEAHLTMELNWNKEGKWLNREQCWLVSWPDTAETLTLSDPWTGPVMSLPFSKPSGVIHKKQWWNWLFANPAGYLPDNAVIDVLEIELPEKKYLNFGPNWMHGWEFFFLSLLMIFSLGIKWLFKIH